MREIGFDSVFGLGECALRAAEQGDVGGACFGEGSAHFSTEASAAAGYDDSLAFSGEGGIAGGDAGVGVVVPFGGKGGEAWGWLHDVGNEGPTQ